MIFQIDLQWSTSLVRLPTAARRPEQFVHFIVQQIMVVCMQLSHTKPVNQTEPTTCEPTVTLYLNLKCSLTLYHQYCCACVEIHHTRVVHSCSNT